MDDNALILEQNNASCCVIWLHGLGADGYDFQDIVDMLGLTDKGIRFVLPHAPMRAVTINGGMSMRAWYDVRTADFINEEDREGFAESEARVRGLICDQVQQGIPHGKIVLAGFSQGAAVALYTSMRLQEQVAGVIALSGYLPFAATTDQESQPANRGIPLFMAHGTQDSVVPFAMGEASHDICRQYFQVQWHSYPIPHSVCLEEIQAIGGWLQQVLAINA